MVRPGLWHSLPRGKRWARRVTRLDTCPDMKSAVRIRESAGHFCATTLVRVVVERLKLGSNQIQIGVNMRRPCHQALLRAKLDVGWIARRHVDLLAIHYRQAASRQEGHAVERAFEQPSLLERVPFRTLPPDRPAANQTRVVSSFTGTGRRCRICNCF